jgi:hypothetical protein
MLEVVHGRRGSEECVEVCALRFRILFVLRIRLLTRTRPDGLRQRFAGWEYARNPEILATLRRPTCLAAPAVRGPVWQICEGERVALPGELSVS